MQKMMKQLIKKIRELCIKRYQDITRYILEAEDEDIEIRTEAVNYLIKNEPYFIEEIKWLKSSAEDRALEKEYKEKIKDSKPAYEYFNDYIDDRTKLVEEMIFRINNKNAKTDAEIKHKQRQLKKFEKELDNLQKSKLAIIKLKSELEPPKRPVGRPKKNKEETMDKKQEPNN